MTVIDLKQRHNAWKALEASSVEPILLEKILAEDRSSWLNNSSQDDIEYIAQWNRWLQRAVSGNREINPADRTVSTGSYKTVINWKAICS